jgi:hypothetical protein
MASTTAVRHLRRFMSANRIVCTEQSNTCPRWGHIIAVGVGNDPAAASQKMTVSEVYNAMDRGQTFFTKDRYGNVASVRKYTCGCGRATLRSAADASSGNNLDNLRTCAWRAA